MECKHKISAMCEVMVGLGKVEVLEAGEPLDGARVVEFRTTGVPRPSCPRVWQAGVVERREVGEPVDLLVSGWPVRLGWRKRWWEYPDSGCGVGSFHRAGSPDCSRAGLLTCRAARWAGRRCAGWGGRCPTSPRRWAVIGIRSTRK